MLFRSIIPQRTNRENAQLLLEQKRSELNAIKIEYEREQANLDYMQTDEYKLQQGSVRYGWHYTDDTIILDDDEPLAGGNPWAHPWPFWISAATPSATP